MQWPPWPFNAATGRDKEKKAIGWNESLNAIDWAHYSEPQAVIPTLLLTGTTLLLIHLYRSYLRRIPEAASIQPAFFRRRSLYGRVTSVGDGDNFRLFHTPGGRLSGWGWMPGRRVPEKREDLKDRTVGVSVLWRSAVSPDRALSEAVDRSTCVWLVSTLPSSPTLVGRRSRTRAKP